MAAESGPVGGSPDELLQRAWAIRHLLDDTPRDDHAARIRLTAAMDGVHHEAAQAWRARGWRPITEPPMVDRPARSLLVAPLLAAAAAAWLSVAWLGGRGGVLTVLVVLAGLPLLAEQRQQPPGRVRALALGAGACTAVYVVTGAMPATLVLLPATVLLLAVGTVGTRRGVTSPRGDRRPHARRPGPPRG